MNSFAPRGTQADDSLPTPALETLDKFQLRDGLEIELVASEPAISQPLFLTWDSRGRLWVVQYRQYQYPAGLKVVQFDQHLRAVFDKVPAPPPQGVKGLDRITVFEDTTGDGKYDQHKDVVTGLNIASSVQIGPNGVWVLNPPYLLHYPDRDHDDIPDGDPEVHLSGFGLQDTHSVANSMIWGPDGWLYGANGSTTTGTISSKVTKGIGFEGQCIWRYHPTTHVFEIFAEGGGNTFSLDIDSKGRVFSGTNGGNTRGYYYPQGSYADKNWGKHGPLTNPFAFGYFRSMPLQGDPRRFAQAFSIYEGGLLADQYKGTIIAPNSLHNLVWNSQLLEHGSGYQTIDQPNLLTSQDRWFRPVYSGTGPDGAVYLADWYDTRLSHVSPIDNWHKSSGRIYRVQPAGSQPTYQIGNLGTQSSQQLIDNFQNANKWVRRRSMLELGWRNDLNVVSTLNQKVEEEASLESLWALNLMNQVSTTQAIQWINHEDPHIRRWIIRILGDRHEGVSQLAVRAALEEDLQVCSQLASTAKRIDASNGLAVVGALAARNDLANDPHLPLLCWWAFEAHADQWDEVNDLLRLPSFWSHKIVQEHLLERLMRRYALEDSETTLERCAQLIEMAPDQPTRQRLIRGLDMAFQGRSIPKLPGKLDDALAEYQRSLGDSGIIIMLRSQQPGSTRKAIQLLKDNSTDPGVRIRIVQTLSELKSSQSVDAILNLAVGRSNADPTLQRVAIGALTAFDDDRIPRQLIGSLYSNISAEHNLRSTACRTLASRKKWANALLNELNQWRLKPKDIPPDVVQQLRAYRDPEISAAVQTALGAYTEISTPEKLSEIKRLTALLNDRSGDPVAGRTHFLKNCGNCHQLFGEGQQIGPALDGYERGNLKFWLPAIIEPSLEIREGYQSYKVVTDDGRLITGMIESQDQNTVTLRVSDTQTTLVRRDNLEELTAVRTSLMPERLLDPLTDQQKKDLFAYLALGSKKPSRIQTPPSKLEPIQKDQN